MNTPRPTVCIVDDDPAIRDSLALLLGLKGLSTQVFASAETFLAAHDPEAPGCLLVDVRMERLSGLALLARLRGLGDARPCIVMTAHGDVSMAREALKGGAFDFLEKPLDNEVLLDVIRNAIEADLARRASRERAEQHLVRLERLTPRERDVLALLLEGHQNREIAERLGISARTVEVYKARVMEKLDARSLADLLALTRAASP
jgi:FixJ family two-component response regulator